MDTSSIYRYEYFLPTQGIDAARGQIDLQRVFGQPGELCSIELRSFSGRSGLYVRASLELSREVIARLAGRTRTPLERLRPIETRIVTHEPSSAAAPARRPAVVATSLTAGYQMQASPVAVPASQSTYEQFPSHRRESDVGSRQLMAGAQSYFPNRPTYPPDRSPANVYSYSASQYYRSDSPEQGQDGRISPSGARPGFHNERQDEEDEVSPDAGTYESRNDAFFFPPNSVSAVGIQRRRDMINGTRSAADR